MTNNKLFLFLITLFLSQSIFTQEIDEKLEKKKVLAPAKAAFFSAVLPGLGQAYNKKYWKIPIVYAALGSGIYFHNQNNDSYKRYRGAYKRRLAGFSDDEFWGSGVTPNISNDGLIRAQKQLKRNKEMSILVTIGLYALNIIDANVDAHLRQFNVNNDLTLEPVFELNPIDTKANYSISLKYRFK